MGDGGLEPWLCSRGHDKYVYGITKGGFCRECDRLRKNADSAKQMAVNPKSHSRAQFMPGLKQLRRELGITQRRLGDEAGYYTGFICDLENGRKRATPEAVERLLGAIVKIKQERRERVARMKRAGLL